MNEYQGTLRPKHTRKYMHEIIDYNLFVITKNLVIKECDQRVPRKLTDQ